MELRELCVRICRIKGIELTAELEDAIEHWERIFGRDVYSFTDFVDAIALWNPDMGDIDLVEAREVWFEMHRMDRQEAMEVLQDESACGTYQLWGVAQ
jgi:hypothetical protein